MDQDVTAALRPALLCCDQRGGRLPARTLLSATGLLQGAALQSQTQELEVSAAERAAESRRRVFVRASVV